MSWAVVAILSALLTWLGLREKTKKERKTPAAITPDIEARAETLEGVDDEINAMDDLANDVPADSDRVSEIRDWARNDDPDAG